MKKFFTAFIVICLIVGVGYIFFAKCGINIPFIPTNPSENINNKYNDERKDYVVRNKDGIVIGIKQNPEIFTLSSSEKENELNKVKNELKEENIIRDYKQYFLDDTTSKIEVEVENLSASEFIVKYFETLNLKTNSDETFYASSSNRLFGRIKGLGDINGVAYTCEYENDKYYNISIANKYFYSGLKVNKRVIDTNIYKANKDLAKWVVGTKEEISYYTNNKIKYEMDDEIIFSDYNPNTTYHFGLSRKNMKKINEIITGQNKDFAVEFRRYNNELYSLWLMKGKDCLCSFETDFKTIWFENSFDNFSTFYFGNLANHYYIGLFDYLFEEFDYSNDKVYSEWLQKNYEETRQIICNDLMIDYTKYDNFYIMYQENKELFIPYLNEKYNFEDMIAYYYEQEGEMPKTITELNDFEKQIPQKVRDLTSRNDILTGTCVSSSFISDINWKVTKHIGCLDYTPDCDIKEYLIFPKPSNSNILESVVNENYIPNVTGEVNYSKCFD